MLSIGKKIFNKILICFLMVIICLLAGCDTQNDDAVIRSSVDNVLQPISSCTKSFCEDFTEQMDIDQLERYGIDSTKFTRSYFDGFDYAISHINVEENYASANLIITAKSLKAFETNLETTISNLEQATDLSALSEDNFTDIISNAVYTCLDKTPITTSSNITLEFSKEDNKWVSSPENIAKIYACLIQN